MLSRVGTAPATAGAVAGRDEKRRWIDFTSALYLGLHHPSWALQPWAQLTAGVPATLRELPGAEEVSCTLASLFGCERATLGTSTLHLFWDLVSAIADRRSAIYMDAGIYPVGRWGVERAAMLGVPVQVFPHHDGATLGRYLDRDTASGRRPLVVTDGFCLGCGRLAPLQAYVNTVRPRGGRVLIDDTQAVGILGCNAAPALPYGTGGGGSLRYCGLGGPNVIVIASLAKGLGVPLAVLAGSESAVARFTTLSETRMHSSPPSAATLHAAAHALVVNATHGDALRSRLAAVVARFRESMTRIGASVRGGLFPIQTLVTRDGKTAVRLHRLLARQRIVAVLRQSRVGSGPRLTFLFTARHAAADVDRLVHAVADLLIRDRNQIRANGRVSWKTR